MKSRDIGSKKMGSTSATQHSKLHRTLLVCGILSALIWMGADVLASLLYAGYKYPYQPISGLSSIDSPTRTFLIPLVNLYTVLKIAFAVGVWRIAGQNRSLSITAGLLLSSGVVDLVANFFPWNPSESLGTITNIIHGILAGGLTGLLFLLTIAFGAGADGKWFRYYSYGTLIAIIVAGGVMALFGNIGMVGNQPPPWFGLTERINGYGLMVWMLVLAIILKQRIPKNSIYSDKENMSYPEKDTRT